MNFNNQDYPRGSSYVLLVEIQANKSGRFMKISRLQNGVLRSVVVPGGNNSGSWKDLLNCVEDILGRWRNQLNEERGVLNMS